MALIDLTPHAMSKPTSSSGVHLSAVDENRKDRFEIKGGGRAFCWGCDLCVGCDDNDLVIENMYLYPVFQEAIAIDIGSDTYKQIIV
jgi:hypothetical protein